MRQPAIGMRLKPPLSVAAIAPLVLACAVSGVAFQVPPPTPGFPHLATTTAAATSELFGPALVAVARPPATFHIAVATKSAPPAPTVANSAVSLGIPSMALIAYRNAEQKTASPHPGCWISWNLLIGAGGIDSGRSRGVMTDAAGPRSGRLCLSIRQARDQRGTKTSRTGVVS
jgi:membrane-bound lytic murein transglycosylase B